MEKRGKGKKRAEEQELRKKYVKSCRIRHTYGEEEGISEEEALQIAQDAVRAVAADARDISTGCCSCPGKFCGHFRWKEM